MTTFPLTTTLNRIYAHQPCQDGWERGLAAAGKTQGDDKPIAYDQILDAVGLQDAIWCFRSEPQHSRLWRLYAVWCARRVQHLMTDPRSIAALNVAERHANELATDIELDAAWDAAKDAAKDAARTAAWIAAWIAARVAAKDAAWIAAWVVAWHAAWVVAWDAERQAQADAFRQFVTTGTLP